MENDTGDTVGNNLLPM